MQYPDPKEPAPVEEIAPAPATEEPVPVEEIAPSEGDSEK